MTSQFQRRVEEVFLAVAADDPDRRAQRLAEHCGDDAKLRAEVESLLAHLLSGDGMLDRSLLSGRNRALLQSHDAADTSLPPNPNAGGYALKSVIGAGGMGVVYLAVQERTRRTVAVKVIRRSMGISGLLKRFEAEAAMLARLQHPGIAQIFEADVADFGHGPQPFIAMELIDGEPLTEYIQLRKLDVHARVALMTSVCDAVQHAHQRGVIHRDLKPANILVIDSDKSKAAQPKILDFGVARATDADVRLTTLQTSVGQLIGTLAYMSPEQVTGNPQDIDTRCDVYALGVILYELLSGRLPHDVSSRSIPEAVRVIRDESPMRLSSMNRALRGDLDTIVSKTLEKEPSRRYQSAAEVAADLRRYMNDEPIVARRASAWYQFRKFAQRNRKFVAALTGLLIVLIAGSMLSLIFGLQAMIARGLAEGAKGTAEAHARVAASEAARARRAAYVATIAASDGALRVNDANTAHRRLLDIEGLDRNTWEWKYLFNRLDESLGTVEGDVSVYDVALSPDGLIVAGAGPDNRARLWSAGDRSLLKALIGHTDEVTALAFSPDRATIATGAADRTIRLWDVRSGQTQTVLSGHADMLLSVSFSRDGAKLVSTSRDKQVRLWSVPDGAGLGVLAGHEDFVKDAVFNSDGSMIASASADRTVRLWDVQTRTEVAVLRGHTGAVNDVEFNRDGSMLASCSQDRTIRLWNVDTRQTQQILRGHQHDVTSITFSPDDQQILSSSMDGTLRLWDIAAASEAQVLYAYPGRLGDAAWSEPSGLIAASSLSGPIRMWDARIADKPELLLAHESSVLSIAFNSDGSRLASASADRTIRLWDMATAQPTAVLRGHSDWIYSLVFLPDGEHLVSGSYDMTVRLWNVHSEEADAILRGHEARVVTVAAHPDGSIIASGSDDGTVRVWDPQRQSVIRTLDHGGAPVRGISFSPDGRRLASAAADGLVRIWDAQSDRLLTTLRGHILPPNAVAFNADGAVLASSSDDGTVRMWNPETGDLVKPPLAHPGAVTSLAFITGATRLATGGGDGSIRLWDTEFGDEVMVLRGHAYPVLSIAPSPDGSRLATSSLEKGIRLWDTRPFAARMRGETRTGPAR